MSRKLPEEWGDPKRQAAPKEPGLAKKVRDQAAEIERLKDHLRETLADNASLERHMFAREEHIKSMQAQLAEMRTALEDIIKQSVVDAVDDEMWSELIDNARQALATDAGKTAADVLAAVKPFPAMWAAFQNSYGYQEDAFYKLAKGHWSDWEKLCLAWEVYCKEGRDDG